MTTRERLSTTCGSGWLTLNGNQFLRSVSGGGGRYVIDGQGGEPPRLEWDVFGPLDNHPLPAGGTDTLQRAVKTSFCWQE